MPLMRLAWASVTGRTRVSFSRASVRSWRMPAIVEALGNPLVGQPPLAVDLLLLPRRRSLRISRRERPAGPPRARSRPVRGSWPTSSAHSTSGRCRSLLQRRSFARACFAEAASPRPISRLFRLQPLPAGVVDQSRLAAERRQPAVGVVVPQQQAILGPAGEHAIRLVDAARHQVVDQHADVRLAAVEHQRLVALQLRAPR